MNALKPQFEGVIVITDDDDDVKMVDLELGTIINQWYSNVLTNLEKQYPDAFVAVITDILSKHDNDSLTLKKVFGKL